MAEANPSLHPDTLAVKQAKAVVLLPMTFEMRVRQMIQFEATRNAREIVKHRLKAQGVKVSLMSSKHHHSACPRPPPCECGQATRRGRAQWRGASALCRLCRC
jgi:hypothetical protein